MTTAIETILQAAAIPVLDGRICLVTSRSGRRWVIPKGKIERGATPGETALQEAWEEAGLEGELHPKAVGTYVYEKYGNNYHVTVFLMQVTTEAKEWPEQGLRERVWLRPEKALQRVNEAELRELIQEAVG